MTQQDRIEKAYQYIDSYAPGEFVWSPEGQEVLDLLRLAIGKYRWSQMHPNDPHINDHEWD
jgi:hypothetical protein